jgi:serine protease Do
MKYAAQFACIVVLIFASVPSALPAAQAYPQPFAFYGEEPWGGSYLGVDTDDITSERLGALHLKDERGVEVTMVDQDAPAGKAGIKEHDVILTINDQQVQSVEQLRRLIHEIPAGRSISVGISRNGQPMTLHAQLAERKKMPDMNFNFNHAFNVPVVHIPQINIPEIDVPNIVVVHAPRSSGMMIENLTPQLGDYFGVKRGTGVLVRSVERGSRAEQAGIHAGDVIVKINGSAVNDCSDFSRLLRSRTNSKTSVTVMRDRKEQTLTLSLPEPKRTGSLDGPEGCSYLLDAQCAEMQAPEIAKLMPGMTADIKRIQPDLEKMKKQIEAEIRRQKPQMEKLRKEIELQKPEMEKLEQEVQEQVQSHQGEWKKEMEKLQQDMHKQQEELKNELQHMQKHDAEI